MNCRWPCSFYARRQAGNHGHISVVRPFKPDPDKVTLTRVLFAPPALNEQFYENSCILYLKPSILTAARVDDIAAKIKAAGKGTRFFSTSVTRPVTTPSRDYASRTFSSSKGRWLHCRVEVPASDLYCRSRHIALPMHLSPCW